MENDEPEEPKGKKREPRRAVYAVQVGDVGFRIVKCTNFLDLKVGVMVTHEKAKNLIDSGVNFTYGPNK